MSPPRDRPTEMWRFTIDQSPYVAGLLPYSGRLWGAPNSFSVAGMDRTLEVPPGLPRRQRYNAPLTGAIDLGGHTVTLRRTTVGLAYRAALRRNLRGLTRSGPLSFVATLLGGSGLGGGAAGATQTTLTWLIYTLDVDGDAKGSWVGRAVDGVVERWSWVAPGGALPDDQTLEFEGDGGR